MSKNDRKQVGQVKSDLYAWIRPENLFSGRAEGGRRGADFTKAHTMSHRFGFPHLIMFEESGVVYKCQEPQLFVKQTEPIL